MWNLYVVQTPSTRLYDKLFLCLPLCYISLHIVMLLFLLFLLLLLFFIALGSIDPKGEKLN